MLVNVKTISEIVTAAKAMHPQNGPQTSQLFYIEGDNPSEVSANAEAVQEQLTALKDDYYLVMVNDIPYNSITVIKKLK